MARRKKYKATDPAGRFSVRLEERPEGVYVLVHDPPDSICLIEDQLQIDLPMAKRAALQDYGITEDMWIEVID